MSDAPTPPLSNRPEDERLPYGRVIAAGLTALILFTVAVVWERTMLATEVHAALPHGEAPADRVGRDEIGIVDQKMFELEGRAERLRRDHLQRLGSYGWVDRDAGVIHVPIQRAMDDVVQELSHPGESP